MGDTAPASVDDPILGRLEWDDKLDCWAGSVELVPGHVVGVLVSHNFETGRSDDEIAAARRSLATVREREAEYRRWSADVLHEKRWNTDESMTRVEIAELIRVASVEFCADGGIRIYWDDRDQLFWGHNVITEIAPDGTCARSGME